MMDECTYEPSHPLRLPHLTLDDEVSVVETFYDGHLMLEG